MESLDGRANKVWALRSDRASIKGRGRMLDARRVGGGEETGCRARNGARARDVQRAAGKKGEEEASLGRRAAAENSKAPSCPEREALVLQRRASETVQYDRGESEHGGMHAACWSNSTISVFALAHRERCRFCNRSFRKTSAASDRSRRVWTPTSPHKTTAAVVSPQVLVSDDDTTGGIAAGARASTPLAEAIRLAGPRPTADGATPRFLSARWDMVLSPAG